MKTFMFLHMDYVPAKPQLVNDVWFSVSGSHVALGFPSMFGFKTGERKRKRCDLLQSVQSDTDSGN